MNKVEIKRIPREDKTRKRHHQILLFCVLVGSVSEFRLFSGCPHQSKYAVKCRRTAGRVEIKQLLQPWNVISGATIEPSRPAGAATQKGNYSRRHKEFCCGSAAWLRVNLKAALCAPRLLHILPIKAFSRIHSSLFNVPKNCRRSLWFLLKNPVSVLDLLY